MTTFNSLVLEDNLSQVLSDGTNDYLYGNGRIAQTSAIDTQYFLGDALGSVRQLSDGVGVVSLARGYDPFGNANWSVGAVQTPFGYTSEQTDANGLVYLRARYYAPASGRFTTKDPWEGNQNNPITNNKWLYADANPIRYTDPSGFITVDQADQANQIVTDLKRLGVNIKKDWGVILTAVNPSSLPPLIVTGLLYKCEWVAGIWELPALQAVQNGVERITDKMGIVRFKYIFNGVVVSSTVRDNRMYTYGNRDVWVPESVMDNPLYIKHETVHEFAHIWDDTCNDCKSRGMMEATGGTENGNSYRPNGVPPTEYARKNKGEDWTESVTAYLYPEYAKNNPWDEIRKKFVKDALSWYVPFSNINSFPQH